MRAVQVWANMLLGPPMRDVDYAKIHNLVVDGLCENYHRVLESGEIVPLHRHNDFDCDFACMRDKFLAISRHEGGGNIELVTDVTRERIEKEFKRVSWPKEKHPEIALRCGLVDE